MKTFLYVVALAFLVLSGAVADTPQKVTLKTEGMQIKDAVEQIVKQTGAAIVLDPKVQGTVSASLSDADLAQVLDVITKMNNLSWKKMQFAKKTDAKVSLEQLKSTALTLTMMPFVGFSVEDPETKTNAVYAKELKTVPDTSQFSLPEGYTWTTVYVVLAPESPNKTPTDADKLKSLSEENTKLITEVANMTSEERQAYYQNQWMAQFNLTSEARQSMFEDMMTAMRNLDPQYQEQMRQDMHAMWEKNGGGWRQNQQQ